jgi:hypothetical protein
VVAQFHGILWTAAPSENAVNRCWTDTELNGEPLKLAPVESDEPLELELLEGDEF